MMRRITDTLRYKGVLWKIPVASALAWEVAKWAGSKHPYLAPLMVILSIQLTVEASVQFVWKRVLGTVVGVLLAVLAEPYISLSGWGIGLLLLVANLLVMWLKWDHVLLVQVALSVLLVQFFQGKMPSYPLDRIRDTIIGAVIALAIHILVFPPDSIHKAQKKRIQFADHLSSHFASTALWVQNGCLYSQAPVLRHKLKSLFQELHQTTNELDTAEQSLRYHPLGTSKQANLTN